MMAKIAKWKLESSPTLDWFTNKLTFIEKNEVDLLKSETLRILERCSNPAEEESSRSVLVVGEVQSGKTLSFTSLISAGRDAGYQLTVLFAGTKQNLRDQTHSRLLKDLEVSNGGGAQTWEVHKSPNAKAAAKIVDAVATWKDPSIPFSYRKSTVLIGMKTPAGIRKIDELLQEVAALTDQKLSILFVDDEADQASLNTAVSRADVSATYSAITDIRTNAKSHSYVMYTATSQALLLLEFADHLSPDSVVVLASRPSYVGGEELFNNPNSEFPKSIPDSEIQVATSPMQNESPPNSLLNSLSYFALALVVAQRRQNPKPLSMLIHPASTKQTHETYRHWVRNVLNRWVTQLGTEEMFETFETDFELAYRELSKTVDIASEFGPVLNEEYAKREFIKELRYWILQIEIRVVNSEAQINQIRTDEWQSKPGWIVIGGAKLERGFTIENLAVTYMPRGIGIGAADTIQQRGRFFGHKRKYLDLLRGWINDDTKRAFRSIVETEKQMRKSLESVQNDERPLQEWRREFLLSPGMQATRRAVISLGATQFNLRAGFQFKQSFLFHPGLESDFDFARALIAKPFDLSTVSQLDTRKQSNRHRVATLTLDELKYLVLHWPVSVFEKPALDVLLVAIGFYADHNPHLNAHIYFMDGLSTRSRGVSPSVGTNPDPREWRITNLHQGRDNLGKYPGDSSIRTPDAISIQIHRIAPKNGTQIYPDVLALAVSWPTGFDKIVLMQD